MFKRSILGLVCAAFIGAAASAQERNDLVYVSDPSQGYLMGRFSNNWFATAEAGVNLFMSQYDSNLSWTNRIAPAGSLYIGKWFSPIIGVRVGGSYVAAKSLSLVDIYHTKSDMFETPDGQKFYRQYHNEFGIVGDFMVNLTNWWCGYRPGRLFNSSIYFGGGAYWTFARVGEDNGWKNAHIFNTSLRAGWVNTFRISNKIQIFFDLRFSSFDTPQKYMIFEKHTAGSAQVFLGVNYNIRKSTWDAPRVPVCSDAPDCSAVEARLQAANARIADLERQLKDCLTRPGEKVEVKSSGSCKNLTTIYFPINRATLTSREVNVLRAVAAVMIQTGKRYTLTGWADNYTGTEAFNVRLRHSRVDGVKRQLLRFGVPEKQLNATVNNGNLTDYGVKAVHLDRAVTIEETQSSSSSKNSSKSSTDKSSSSKNSTKPTSDKSSSSSSKNSTKPTSDKSSSSSSKNSTKSATTQSASSGKSNSKSATQSTQSKKLEALPSQTTVTTSNSQKSTSSKSSSSGKNNSKKTSSQSSKSNNSKSASPQSSKSNSSKSTTAKSSSSNKNNSKSSSSKSSKK